MDNVRVVMGNTTIQRGRNCMTGGDCKKSGLAGCDILKPGSNKNCAVVVDVKTGRLVELQPDNTPGAHK